MVAHLSKVVTCHARANNNDALVTERGYCSAQRIMLIRVLVMIQTDLYQGYIERVLLGMERCGTDKRGQPIRGRKRKQR